MLQAQVNYWTLVENKRHNIVSEAVSWFKEQEQQRHNIQTESLGWSTLEETRRHNIAAEQIGWENISISDYNAKTARASQLEQARHNLVTEDVSWYNASSQRISANASASQAGASWFNAQTNLRNVTNQGVRWAEQTAIDQDKVRVSKAELEVHQQNARTNLYSAQINAARALVQNQTDTWNTIERFMPDVPILTLKPIKY